MLGENLMEGAWFWKAPIVSPCVGGSIKEAARTLRKQDPALPENHALNRCEACFN